MGNRITTLAPPVRTVCIQPPARQDTVSAAVLTQLIHALAQVNAKVDTLAVRQGQPPAIQQPKTATAQQVVVSRIADQEPEIEVSGNTLLEFFD